MKKTYQKPEVWVETFVMDASIAQSCDDQPVVDQDVADAWAEVKDYMTWEEFLAVYGKDLNADAKCYFSATSNTFGTMS